MWINKEKKWEKVTCDYCGKIFLKKSCEVKKNKNVFCSTECYHNSQRKFNIFEPININTTKIHLQDNKFALIDTGDVPKCINMYWRINDKGYVVSSKRGTGHQTSLHALIMDRPEGLVVDHINKIKYDNRKENLRVCKQIDNCQNKVNRVNKVSGVSFEAHSKKWFAYIGFEGKKISLGRYKEYKEAVAARKAAEEKLHGGVLCI